MRQSFIYGFVTVCISLGGVVQAEAEPVFSLWTKKAEFPAPALLPFPDVITYVRVHHAVEKESQFLHGASIVWFKDRFYVCWANSPIDENSSNESVRGRTSVDGLSWSEPFVLAPDLPGPERRSHGVFWIYDGRLYLFAARFTGPSKPLVNKKIYFEGLKTEVFSLNEVSQEWEPLGIVTNDFWPLDEPTKMPDGNWIIGGIDTNFGAAAAILDKSDMYHWQIVKIPQSADRVFSETTIVVADDIMLAIMRNPSGNVAAVSRSTDCGKTWSMAWKSNFPMTPSKPFAGRLSDGRRYLICNVGRDRNVLSIALGDALETDFSRIWTLRSGISREPVFPGWAKGPQWSYPYAIEKDGRLFVVYSVGKEDCELAIIPLSSLN